MNTEQKINKIKELYLLGEKKYLKLILALLKDPLIE